MQVCFTSPLSRGLGSCSTRRNALNEPSAARGILVQPVLPRGSVTCCASRQQPAGGRRPLFGGDGDAAGGDYSGYSTWEPQQQFRPLGDQGEVAGGDDWVAVEQGSDAPEDEEWQSSTELAPSSHDWVEEDAFEPEEEEAGGVPRERVYLVGVALKTAKKRFGYTVRESLEELGRLSDTAGLRVVGSTYQVLETPNMATYIGSGKVAEVSRAVKALQVDTVVFDDELSPGQLRNLERAFGGAEGGVRVCDRTALILDIFSQRAQTKEGKLQVELAQLEYQLPRLTRLWTHLERQSGGGQVKGMGEKQIEVDKRLLRDRIAQLKRDLEHVRTHRRNYRTRRAETPIPVVALVGYTNAGKSTLLNRLTNAGVLAEDKLFATLDPTTRRVRLPGNQEVLVSDTVGFIQKLPTTLVAAFRATLEEVVEASVLLHVVDVSHPNAAAQSDAVMQVLAELKGSSVPLVTAWNKVDAAPAPDRVREVAGSRPDTVAISGVTGEGVEELLATISAKLAESMAEVEVLLPYSAGDLLDAIHKLGTVQGVEYTEHGTRVSALVPQALAGRLLEYSSPSGREPAAAAAVVV